MPAKCIVESYPAKWELQQQTNLSQCIHVHCLAGPAADPLLGTHPKSSCCNNVHRLQGHRIPLLHHLASQTFRNVATR